MKLLKIYSNDHELFGKDIDSKDSLFYQWHIPTFKHMWNDQGSTFWLRFLVSFREFMKAFNYENMYTREAHGEFSMCSHNFFRYMEFGFIHIHEMFLEGDFNSAKTLIGDIFTLAQNLHFLPQAGSFSVVYDAFYSTSTGNSFRKLFGSPQNLEMKLLVNYPVYLKFGGAILQLLRRWLTTEDVIPDKDLPNVNNHVEYWYSFEPWLMEDFCAENFEIYIAKYWDKKLPAMLLISNVHTTFLQKKVGLCDCDDNNNKHLKNELLKNSKVNSEVKSLCKKHWNCHKKVIHNLKCKDPQFCCAENSICKLSCETEIKLRKIQFNSAIKIIPSTPAKDRSVFWKLFEVYAEPYTEKECRSVGTMAISYDYKTETYYPNFSESECAHRNLFDGKSNSSCTATVHLTAEAMNSVKQCKKIEAVKRRLRDKLQEKYITKSLLLLEDPEYRLKMFEEASKRFRRDLEAEAKTCGCNDWEAHIKDTCPSISAKVLQMPNNEKMEDVHIDIQNKEQTAEFKYSTNEIICFSVGVGTDDQSAFGKVIEARKKKSKKKKNSIDITSEEEKFHKNSTTFSPSNEISSCDDLKGTSDHVTKDHKFGYDTAMSVMKLISINDSTYVGSSETPNNTKCTVHEDISDFDDFSNNLSVNSKDPEILNRKCELEYGENKAFDELKLTKETNETKNFHDVEMYTNYTNVSEYNIDHLDLTKSDENIPDAVDALISVLTTGRNINRRESDASQKAPVTNETSEIVNNEIKENQTVISRKRMKKLKLHVCAHCKQKETVPRTFKKCGRCKAENFPEPRYYCARQCQVEDWEEFHRNEHLRDKKTI